MADFPRITYKQIDQHPIAFTEPQHFTSGDETVRTGEDNPLPTKDVEVKAELETIKAMQQQILERLDEPIDTQLIGSIVERAELMDEAGTVPAGTWKEIRTDDKGNSLRSPVTHKDISYVSLFFRRSQGEIADVSIVFGGLNSVERTPEVKFSFVDESFTVGVSEKVPMLTNDFTIFIKASDGGDLICRDLYLYLWER